MTALPFTLLPETAAVDPDGMLLIGGCRMGDLAREHGTPLFVYDETHLRARCREAVAAFPDGVSYATKAFLCGAMARLAHEEGMRLDVSTGGELGYALAAGIPADRLVFHGNNKSDDELREALGAEVGQLVIDSAAEIDRIEMMVAEGLRPPRVMIRVNPGVEAHTHEFLRTGTVDSKFGIPVESGAAASAMKRAARSGSMILEGVHAHVGSQVFDVGFFEKALSVIAEFVGDFDVEELSIGGGLGVAYVEGEEAPSITDWGNVLAAAARSTGIRARLVAEPGRSIVAKAAITLYTVGVIKEIPGIRTYVAVDGGMSDNPRPVLYGSGYEVFAPASTNADRTREIRLVGKHCESGDVLARNGMVPESVAVGDLLATPVTGAYGHSMGSNYNMVRRPAVVFAGDGDARLVVRRETYQDLWSRDLVIAPGV
ncbi:MAG: diaminopimelate decarboxylase [Acidimicrobiia bacterium]